MKNITLMSFVISATTALAATASPPAQAAFRRFSSTSCARESDFITDYVFTDNAGTTDQVGRTGNSSGSRSRLLRCPIPDESDYRNKSITAVLVDFDDENTSSLVSQGSIGIFVCRDSNVGMQSICGIALFSSPTGTGIQDLGVASDSGSSGNSVGRA